MTRTEIQTQAMSLLAELPDLKFKSILITVDAGEANYTGYEGSLEGYGIAVANVLDHGHRRGFLTKGINTTNL